MSSESSIPEINCPTCDVKVVWSKSNPYRPFCSERCKLIDFGEWATEKHAIAGQPLYPIAEDDIEDENLQ